VIVPDLNVLVYAYDWSAPNHHPARTWWEQAISDGTLVGLTWPVMHGYIRLMTHPRVMTRPLSASTALSDVREWLSRPTATVLTPGPNHLQILERILSAAGTAADLTTDAVIAALAIENQATLYSNDLDFARFPGLRWVNPLD
jgi:hypothetical protein